MDSSTTPVSFRPRTSRRSTSFSQQQGYLAQAMQRFEDLKAKGLRIFWRLTTAQRIGLVVAAIILNVLGILSIIYHKAVFDWLTNFSKGWRDITGGWLILWAITFGVSFPPLIGYSTCVMLGGYIFGFPKGSVYHIQLMSIRSIADRLQVVHSSNSFDLRSNLFVPYLTLTLQNICRQDCSIRRSIYRFCTSS